jgi:hypothetical protein
MHRPAELLLILLMVAPSILYGQKGPGTTSSQTTPSASTAPASPNAAQTQGITGGAMPIESTLFAYKALAADSKAIAADICPSAITCKDKVFIIALPSDVAALVEWRTVLGQIEVLTNRTNAAALATLAAITPAYTRSAAQLAYAPAPAARQQMVPHAAIVGTSSDVQTLAQTAMTLASSFSVNEALTPASGAISDLPLTNMVLREMQAKGATVFSPSVYPPNLLTNSDLTGTVVYDRLLSLEANRAALRTTVQQYAQASAYAASISQDPNAPDFQAAITFNKTGTTVVALLTALESQIDSFEGSLFSGQSTATPNQQTSGGAPVSPLVSGGAPPTPNPSNPTMPQSSTTNGNGTILQQVLQADLLVRRIWGSSTPSSSILSDTRILTVHALESGGGQLTKTNLFTGTKVYFGGGSVATYTLFRNDGSIQCAGYVYGYRGYVREKDFEHALGGADLKAYSSATGCSQ